MADTPRPSGEVLRRNPERECGTPVGQLNIKIKGIPDFQVVSFYCTLPRLHTEACCFVGSEVVVQARRRGDGRDALHLSRG